MSSAMLRLKLWAFYQLMAWNSLIRPSDGQQMIDLAHECRPERDREATRKAIFGMAQKARQDVWD